MNVVADCIEARKRRAAEAAATEVRDGMLVGLGTGSTAAWAIRAIGAAGARIDAVATSEASAALARSVGIAVRDFADVTRIDLTIDGADEIDDGFRAIKGAGGAMLREKVVAAASDRMVVVADASKRVVAIGAAKLPVEVLPFARAYVADALGVMFGRVEARADYRTDNGNLVLDCRERRTDDWDKLAHWLEAVPGIVGHGLFLSEVDAAYIASDSSVTRVERAGRSG
jgi:ribose 5-phosphate isomerase A